ncbi:hypothetical protein BDV95DRAFT_202450 [Massariosphaeria phaeospora]|uniref:WHIM1 domain-containing protein n=1 Tax=Massariosphaeria phaeospora TaxID=100035 RepID=A0A7C8HZQ4_9PLEO|nr:hypothetical protein BDV95DRAFT_202450 [Massariosphaeria phaeospora]
MSPANTAMPQFIVMFRSRFNEAFPPKCPHFGPQDIEHGVVQPLPSSQIEGLLCALLGLVLNRKKPVEKGHYGRALEEAIQTQKSQWPRAWNSINPLSGGRSFNGMPPTERLTLLKTLVLWSLNQSEVVSNMIKEGYKTRTTKDKTDTNIPLSVQPWGRDGDKRRYWLVEGRDDTNFRVYRESNPNLKSISWWSVAGSIDDVRTLAKKLEEEDGTREAKTLSEKMLNAVPRFEATEDKRKRREYRLNRKATFARPDPGFSLYEGRTRGKRMKYTFSDEEDYDSDDQSVRRSTRTSGRETPVVPSGPTVTASGRQVRSRATGTYGETLLSGQTTERASPATGEYVRSNASEEPQPTHGRSTRAANKPSNGWPKGRQHIETYNSVDEMDDEDDATSWDGGDEEEETHMELDQDEDGSSESSDDGEPKSLVVTLKYPKGAFNPTATPAPLEQVEDQISATTPQNGAHKTGPPLSGLGAPRQAEPPAGAAQSTAPPVQCVIPNGVRPSDHVTTSVQETLPRGDATALPKLDSLFSAPTPPYSAPEEAATKPQPQFAPANHSESHAPRPFPPTLPAATPASSWQ